jgi:hypothetical protein
VRWAHIFLLATAEVANRREAEMASTFETDGYRDGFDRKSFSPPSISIYAAEYGRGYDAGHREGRDHRCTFAPAGTYGHECGKPATHVGLFSSDVTQSGIFYGRRCEDCQQIRGGENNGVLKWERLDAARHVNQFKR